MPISGEDEARKLVAVMFADEGAEETLAQRGTLVAIRSSHGRVVIGRNRDEEGG